jgi:peptidyl-prolyl cis-trans isomerase SurA
MMKLGTFGATALALVGSLAAAAALAQSATGTTGATPRLGTLNIPQDAKFVGPSPSNVRKATAIVNGVVLTRTDVDQRLALIRLASGGEIPADELPRLRQQVLRNLVDEVLQIQAAEQADIKIKTGDVDSYFTRYAKSQFDMSAEQLSAFLRSNGSSAESIKRQIHGEMAWSRLQRNKIEPFVSVSEDEVKAVIDRLNASRGTQEFKVSEIFISATPETAAEARSNADRIVQQLRTGASFLAYARQFSEASTAAVGGELGWVRAEQLPDALSAAVKEMPVGSISPPLAVPGGFSIVALADTRQVLTADPRDALLSLKQISLSFAPKTPKAAIQSKLQALAEARSTMGGCGGAEAAAQRIGAEVISNDQIRVRDLPPGLQPVLLNLSVGEATAPFGVADERVSVLVLCGRDDPNPATTVSFDQVYNQLAENRVNLRARRYLRDLRRDAVVEYR